MRHVLLVILCLAFEQAAASGPTVKSRELVHAYSPTGPAEVAGTVAAGKALRTLQRYAAPAFTDILAMHVARTLQGASHHPVEVTRRPRHGGHDAAAAVSSAAADGRTLLLASGLPAPSTAGSQATMPAALTLQPVALVASMPYVVIATSETGPANLHDLIRRSQSRLLVASAGGSSPGHVAIERMRSRQGLPIEPVPYNGGIAAMHAVATKQIRIALIPLPAVLPYLGAGRVRILAVAEPRRHPAIPHVLTTVQGGLAGLEATGWFGVFAPGGTPQAVIRELDAALALGPESEQTLQVFFDFGLRLEHRTADVFAGLLELERQRRSSAS